MEASSPELKVCRKCGYAKLPERFARDRKCRDGLSTKCKDCMAAYASERYQRQRMEAGRTYRPALRIAEWLAVEEQGTMPCRRCHEVKPLEEFRISYRAPRRRRVCRECERKRCAELRELKHEDRRAYSLRFRCRQYGITPRDYEQMLQAQRGLCAVCSKPLGQRLQTIDHCHRTGKVRGIVHPQCNLVLGNAREDVEVLRGAIAYLSKHHVNAAPDMRERPDQGERL